VRIFSGLGRQQCWDTLHHEWCHLVRIEQDGCLEHDDEFWKLYGEMYRAVLRNEG